MLQQHLNLRLEAVYATNAFVFIKPGGMSGRIPKSDMMRSVREFTVPEIELLLPQIIVALGAATWTAPNAALPDKWQHKLLELPHPAARISNAAMNTHWRSMRKLL